MKTTDKIKALLLSSLGAGLEVYDFTIYVFLAPVLATLFFPAHNESISLLNSFAVFAIGYFSRPLGAMIFGHFGDKHGRKTGMLISIAIMGISTLSIGCLPTYSEVGIFAPILLILCRFLQGFALGGDLPGAITFMAEYSGENQRGLFCSLIFCAVNLGLLIASMMSASLSVMLSHEALVSWGWRIPFLFGMVIAVVGYYLRTQIEETPYFLKLTAAQHIIKIPLKELFQFEKKEVFMGIGLVWTYAVINAQIYLHMPTFLHTVNGLSLTKALIINSINILFFCLCIPLMGLLTDKIGRRTVLKTAATFFILGSFPVYFLVISSHPLFILLGLMIFSIFSAGVIGALPAALSELFSTHVRYSGIAIAYNIGFAIFAGLTPLLLTFLLYQFHNPKVVSLNLLVGGFITLIVTFFMPKTRELSLK